MRKKIKKPIAICLVLTLILSMSNIMLAHSGRTDSNGGHRDNKNVSGLGPYHYHCGGHPPHLHSGGVCEYETTSQPAPQVSTSPTPSPSPQSPSNSQSSHTASQIAAIPTSSRILIDDMESKFDAYTINGSNYFKLRDLAYSLNGTAKQFDVTWDDTNGAINITSGRPYTSVGGEMSIRSGGNITPVIFNSKILINGKLMEFTAYTIFDNTYFMLRDIAGALNFDVDWDDASNTISIHTSS